MEKRSLSIVTLVGLLMLLSVNVESDDKKALRIACLPNVSPFIEQDTSGGWSGPDVDVITEMFRRSELELEIVMRPAKRMFMQMQNGEIDGTCTLFRNAEREHWAKYVVPVHYSVYKVYVKKGNEFLFTGNTEELFGKRVGKTRGYYFGEDFDAAQAAGHIKVVEGNKYKSLFAMLEHDRIDMVIGNTQMVQRNLKDLGKEGSVSALPISYFFVPSYLALSKNAQNPDLNTIHKKLSEAYLAMESENFMRDLSDKYPDYQFWPDMSSRR